jgi:hypothetical protein
MKEKAREEEERDKWTRRWESKANASVTESLEKVGKSGKPLVSLKSLAST